MQIKKLIVIPHIPNLGSHYIYWYWKWRKHLCADERKQVKGAAGENRVSDHYQPLSFI
jgi:hypothetical protein